MALLMVCGGIFMLAVGASWLVDGASRLALRLGVSAMIVGLTVVGFGTSMPEFSVSVLASVRGSASLGIGNAVGSNVMNLLLVLGVAAALNPMKIDIQTARHGIQRDLLFGLAPAVILLAAAWKGFIHRPTALLLLLVFTVFIVACIRQARGDAAEPVVVGGSLARHLVITAIGIAVLVGGAELMVRGGVNLARIFGISEAVIGLTLVAFGTSLPELATSVAAAIKGQADISMGNVLGSNVFNLGLIVGTAFTIRPAAVPLFVIRQDVPFLLMATILVALMLLRDGRISRLRGVLLLLLFSVYLGFLFVRGG
jgi:cation:H+ antiporter